LPPDVSLLPPPTGHGFARLSLGHRSDFLVVLGRFLTLLLIFFGSFFLNARAVVCPLFFFFPLRSLRCGLQGLLLESRSFLDVVAFRSFSLQVFRSTTLDCTPLFFASRISFDLRTSFSLLFFAETRGVFIAALFFFTCFRLILFPFRQLDAFGCDVTLLSLRFSFFSRCTISVPPFFPYESSFLTTLGSAWILRAY